MRNTALALISFVTNPEVTLFVESELEIVTAYVSLALLSVSMKE
jgi:hypothetical protein